jgi:hypothetical protein
VISEPPPAIEFTMPAAKAAAKQTAASAGVTGGGTAGRGAEPVPVGPRRSNVRPTGNLAALGGRPARLGAA